MKRVFWKDSILKSVSIFTVYAAIYFQMETWYIRNRSNSSPICWCFFINLLFKLHEVFIKKCVFFVHKCVSLMVLRKYLCYRINISQHIFYENILKSLKERSKPSEWSKIYHFCQYAIKQKHENSSFSIWNRVFLTSQSKPKHSSFNVKIPFYEETNSNTALVECFEKRKFIAHPIHKYAVKSIIPLGIKAYRFMHIENYYSLYALHRYIYVLTRSKTTHERKIRSKKKLWKVVILLAFQFIFMEFGFDLEIYVCLYVFLFVCFGFCFESTRICFIVFQRRRFFVASTTFKCYL